MSACQYCGLAGFVFGTDLVDHFEHCAEREEWKAEVAVRILVSQIAIVNEEPVEVTPKTAFERAEEMCLVREGRA